MGSDPLGSSNNGDHRYKIVMFITGDGCQALPAMTCIAVPQVLSLMAGMYSLHGYGCKCGRTDRLGASHSEDDGIVGCYQV